MAKVTFIGVGNMGGPMAINLIKAGHEVTAVDLVEENLEKLKAEGAKVAHSAAEAMAETEVVISMLPAGQHVKAVYGKDVFPNANSGTLLIDCSTIDVDSAREVQTLATEAGFPMVDAPVSGGVGGAAAGTLTFMVGGEDTAYAAAEPFLQIMGKTLVHCGGAGNGQAAKICNNMMLGIQMISVAEAFALGEKLGLSHQKLFDVSSTASGQCWSLTTYCPVPEMVPTSPANNEYKPGFASALMLKDLRLAQAAAESAGAVTPLGEHAERLYEEFSESGGAGVDFSGIIKMLREI
ncbi:3-hydroxyisobutyrate dehydrogenase [Curvivirga sp.]|uniref:3-hydroxyisobutyrate dehydrogenase n=1 Tax=Curvivirga sp. TaxID=2856848 RepID=UPI003B5B4A98